MLNNAKTPEAIYREARRASEAANKFSNGQLFGQVTKISGFDERARVTGFPTSIVIQHPFISSNAWIRALPEIGSPIMAYFNKESNEAVHSGYRNIDPTEALQRGAEGSSLYNELLPGEIELLSKGLNHHYLTARPYDVRESGLVKSILDGDTSCMVNKAVTYIDYLHQNEVATIKDTRRFGVVRRPENSIETRLIRAPDSELGDTPTLDKPGFAKELSTILVSRERTLLDYREGHVVDDNGKHPISSWTGNNLRVRKIVYNVKDNQTKYEIDNKGNFDLEIPIDAENGIRINVFGGSLDAKVNKEISFVSTGNSLYKAEDESTITVESGYYVGNISKDITITSQGNTTIQADNTSTLNVGGFLTNLGQLNNANHPLLFGDTFIQEFMQLLISLATHVHPGISTPSPDLASACIALASKCPGFVSCNVQTQ